MGLPQVRGKIPFFAGAASGRNSGLPQVRGKTASGSSLRRRTAESSPSCAGRPGRASSLESAEGHAFLLGPRASSSGSLRGLPLPRIGFGRGSLPASTRARRRMISIWALTDRRSSAAHLAIAPWTAGSSRRRSCLRLVSAPLRTPVLSPAPARLPEPVILATSAPSPAAVPFPRSALSP